MSVDNNQPLIALDGEPITYIAGDEMLAHMREVVAEELERVGEDGIGILAQAVALASSGPKLAALARAQQAKIAALESALAGCAEPRDAPLDSDAEKPIACVPDASGPRGAVEAKLLDVLKDLEWIEDGDGPLTTCLWCQAKHSTGEPSTHEPGCQIAEALAMAEGGRP